MTIRWVVLILLILTESNNTEPMSIRGNHETSRKYININLYRCDNSTHDWASPEFIEEALGKTLIRVILGDSYITFGDGIAQVKNSTKVVDEYCSSDAIKIMDIFVRKNEYSYSNSLILDTKAKKKFYSFSEEKRYFENNRNGKIMEIKILLDYRQDSYDMTVYTFWDMIGLIGGVYEFVKVMLGIFINFYASRLMKIDLINAYKSSSNANDKPDEDEENINNGSFSHRRRRNRLRDETGDENSKGTEKYTYWDIFSHSITGFCDSSSKIKDINSVDLTYGQRMLNEI